MCEQRAGQMGLPQTKARWRQRWHWAQVRGPSIQGPLNPSGYGDAAGATPCELSPSARQLLHQQVQMPCGRCPP